MSKIVDLTQLDKRRWVARGHGIIQGLEYDPLWDTFFGALLSQIIQFLQGIPPGQGISMCAGDVFFMHKKATFN